MVWWLNTWALKSDSPGLDTKPTISLEWPQAAYLPPPPARRLKETVPVSSSAQGLGGVSKKRPVLTGRAKESSLQSGDQLTLEMRSTIPSLVSRLYLRLLLPKLLDHTHLRTVELRLLGVGRTWALD